MMESSDKEVRAIFLNFKELRCLEKNMQALDLEKSYNVSLINLDQKVVKVKYKRLKEKVSRIKSHLSQDELDELKKLEEDGKLNIKAPSSDLNIKIIAAEKRLKLLPRSKSAVPRLQSETNTDKKMDLLKTPRSARRVQTPTETPRAGSARRVQTPTGTPRKGSARRVQTLTETPSKELTPRKELSVPHRSPQGSVLNRPTSPRLVNGEEESNYLVPNSVREERRKSIDIRCLNDIKALQVPSVNVTTVKDNYDTNSLHGSNSSQKELDTHTFDLNNDDKDNSLHVSSSGINKRKQSLNNSKDISGNNSSINNKEKTGPKFTSDNTRKPESPIIKVTLEDTNGSLESKASVVEKGSSSHQLDPSTRTRLRPMSVPATQVTNFGVNPKTNRPKTAMELAVETRKKSTIDIRRASSMLKEGKTRSPFSSHEQEAEEKKEKPFRSIREGINTTNSDYEILDNTLGDDLHKEMKKGMILGEVATSLYLEEKIDKFLEKVDGYVKENPNYVYDPNAPKTKKVPRVKERKRPKRNRLRRRQLERQLHEEDIEEMKKSRWLRMDDEQLDISGMNTLVVDQMKMLNRLRYPDDDY